MKYKKRPETIEAYRFRVDAIVPSWFTDLVQAKAVTLHEDETCSFQAGNQLISASKGDYLVLDFDGSVYAVRAELFERNYERVVGRSGWDGRLSV